jgi:hypothetical protein
MIENPSSFLSFPARCRRRPRRSDESVKPLTTSKSNKRRTLVFNLRAQTIGCMQRRAGTVRRISVQRYHVHPRLSQLMYSELRTNRATAAALPAETAWRTPLAPVAPVNNRYLSPNPLILNTLLCQDRLGTNTQRDIKTGQAGSLPHTPRVDTRGGTQLAGL